MEKETLTAKLKKKVTEAKFWGGVLGGVFHRKSKKPTSYKPQNLKPDHEPDLFI